MDSNEAARTGKRRRSAGRAVRLRRWLLGGTVVLVLVLAGLIGYARHRIRSARLDLPRLLGADIKSETDGYTYSQTVKGHTLFTIHAAKAIQHSDGKTTLRNVAVTLYGEPGSNRVDRIRGAQFEYDQSNGIVRAIGESEIDLASPASATEDVPTAKRIHVLANGLVFDQKSGTATTQEALRFEYGEIRGDAVGADFDAHTGVLHLKHDVHLLDQEGRRPRKVTAATAVLDRGQRSATLAQASVTQPGETLHADVLYLQLRPQAAGQPGSLETVRGSGGVMLQSADGAVVTAPLLDAHVTSENHVQSANFTGGVVMRGPQGNGRSGTASVVFDPLGQPTHIRLAQAVQLDQTATDGSVHRLTGDTVDSQLGTDSAGHPVLQQAIASGKAVLRVTQNSSDTSGKQTVLAADTIHAFGNPAPVVGGSRWQLQRVVGDGATRVEELREGDDRVSTANHVEILFARSARSQQTSTSSIESFVQQGHVHATDRHSAGPGKTVTESIADAERAEYTAQTDNVVLTGSPVLRNESMELAATRITIARTSGDAEADGSVKGSYRAHGTKGSTESPLLFLASRAAMQREAQQATLYGGDRAARLWRDASQVEAPVIELDQSKGSLFAHDVAGSHSALAVRAVLPSAQSATQSAHGSKSVRSRGSASMRVISQTLRYRQATGDAPATADFSGGVRLDAPAGEVFSEQAVAVLKSAPKEAGGGLATDNLFNGGGVDTVTADGHVRVIQPGRTAAGSHLVYTSSSQQFVLTGTPDAQPTVHDSLQGTVTGSVLLFHSGDDSVEVTGGSGRQVQTDIDLPPRSSNHSPRPGGTAPGSSSPFPPQR